MQQVHLSRSIRQVSMILILVLLVIVSFRELYVFLPGLLGAVTAYILSRNSYFQLIYKRKWRKGWTAGLYLLIFFLIPAGIMYLGFSMLENQLHPYLNDPSAFFTKMREAISNMQNKAGVHIVPEDFLSNIQKKIADLLPGLVNDTVVLFTNLILLLFLLYYMLVHCKEMELYLERLIPMKKINVHLLATETKRIVRASAIGIPLISLIQGFTATIGYAIFGVESFGLWGFLTGVFAFFPVIGTMIIWIPLVIALYAGGDTANATGLLLYSLIVTGNVDYISRITILKRLGNIHPVVSVLGVIVGLGLFGFVGFVFGPLLVSYIILIFRIYRNEFVSENLSTSTPPSDSDSYRFK